ncbi:SAM dependent carboxyl methyltransferase [Dillenia turbinata]|uniref:SAM dependent carboxyl methyltransferase n=1 Tax=Dillenia turbinata TaxID=194707 RepID=A0AAN8ZB21_9MAGN
METKKLAEFMTMNGGEGQYSYAKNSAFQKAGLQITLEFISEEIASKLEVTKLLSNSKVFKIADLGCSIGPNTFIAVQSIIDAVKLKNKSECLNPESIEFQVLFNDLVSNDFNTLFKSLPERQYFAAAVPGTFYGRLFPEGSLHLVHASYTLQFLSEIPKEILDKNSPAWNGGRIHYSKKEVREAYSAQYAKDMDLFLSVRAKEIIPGGFLAALIPILHVGDGPSRNDAFESCIIDMAKEGLLEEDKVDSFNLPVYFPSEDEFKAIIERNEHFTIERTEKTHRAVIPDASKPSVKRYANQLRSGFEKLLKEHFGVGNEVMDELFDRYVEKLIEFGTLSGSHKSFVDFFVLLKRKVQA